MAPFLRFLKRIVSSDFGIALVVTLVWKIVMLVIGHWLDVHYGGPIRLLDHTMHWDAGWYIEIINGHYTTKLATAAFYPLFPLLVYSLQAISFNVIDYALSGQIINTIAVWFALVAAIKLGRTLLGNSSRFWIGLLLLSAPAAFFMHVFYGEALFVALSFWAYYSALKRRWLVVGILLGILTATRLPSVLIIALCGLEFMRAYNWNLKKIFNKKLLYFLLAPVGFILFGLYLAIVQHDPLGMFHAYSATNDWSYQLFNLNIFATIWDALYQTARTVAGVRPMNAGIFVNIMLPVFSILALAASSIYLIVKHAKNLLPLGIVGLLSIIMFTLNSNLISVHRYILPCLALYVATALFFAKGKRYFFLFIICLAGLLIQGYLLSLFIKGVFAG